MKGTTPKADIDPDSPVPLHEQVAAAVRRAIADGEAKPGERLPPARDMAKVLGVNSNTVFRALHTLRDEGLLEFSRGHGVSVTGVGPQRSAVVTKARNWSSSPGASGTGPTSCCRSSSRCRRWSRVTLLDEHRLTPNGRTEADALIEEARQRQRKRRWLIGSIVARRGSGERDMGCVEPCNPRRPPSVGDHGSCTDDNCHPLCGAVTRRRNTGRPDAVELEL